MLLKLLEPNSDMPKVVVQYFVISMLAKMLEQESSPIAKLNKMLWLWMGKRRLLTMRSIAS